MAGTAFTIETKGVEKIRKVFQQLQNPDLRPLLDALGAEGESQTRRRVSEEKTSPDGIPWAPWSGSYAQSRNGGQSLLQSGGGLVDSLSYQVTGDDTVEWGSNLVYSAIHQFGGAEVDINIPARPYLGLSDENEADMDVIITNWAQDMLQ